MFTFQSAQEAALLFGASALAGAVNSVAGGGTLLTFPALMAADLPSKVANATSTVALWPGGVSSLFGYRREIGETRDSVVPLSIIGLVGGVVGAVLLLNTPQGVFDQVVPFLVLLATTLFMLQEPIARWQRARMQRAMAMEEAGPTTAVSLVSEPTAPKFNPKIIPLVFAIAVYGGYFGAGIGILTLAALGFLGYRNIHQMNGVKNIFTLFINGVAAVIFLFRGLVDWKVTLFMAFGAIVGGYCGAGVARRIGQKNVRRVVIGIGFALTLSLLARAYGGPRTHHAAATRAGHRILGVANVALNG